MAHEAYAVQKEREAKDQPRPREADLRHVTIYVTEHALARYWPLPKSTEENREERKRHKADSVVISLRVEELLEAVSGESVWETIVWPKRCLDDQVYEEAWIHAVSQDFVRMYLDPRGGNDLVAHRNATFALIMARAQLALAIHVAECLDLGDTSLLRNHRETLVGPKKDQRTLFRPEGSREFLVVSSFRVEQGFETK